MSSRDWFWFLAGVLITVAITATLRAWARERPAQAVRSAIPTFAIPVAALLGLVGVALGIYFLLGSPDSIASSRANAAATVAAMSTATSHSSTQMGQAATNAGSLDEVTQKLANRLATQGGADSEWQLLAESYEYMGRTADANAAREHKATAVPLSAGSSAMAGGAESSNDAGRDVHANSGFDGQTMAAVADALDNGRGGTLTVGATSPPIETSAGDSEISGTVDIVGKLSSRVPAGTTLFIYAKQPNIPGPPLAVVRLRLDHWPIRFTLSDANAMVPGRNLSNSQTVQIEARISRTGAALPQSGDLVGTVTGVNPRGAGPVKISIDREID